MTDKEAMAMALDALETLMIERGSIYEKAIAALKERLAQPEQEPVAWPCLMWPCLIDSADFSANTITIVMQCDDYKVSAGTHWLSPTPPQRTEPIQSLQCFHCQVTIETLNDKVMQLMAQRTWVGLTDDEQQQAYEQWQNDGWGVFYSAIEAKLKEKNT
jgi:hypothetical protein